MRCLDPTSDSSCSEEINASIWLVAPWISDIGSPHWIRDSNVQRTKEGKKKSQQRRQEKQGRDAYGSNSNYSKPFQHFLPLPFIPDARNTPRADFLERIAASIPASTRFR